MDFSFQGFLGATIVLFSIINTIGNIPIFLKIQDEGKTIYPGRAALMSLLMLFSFFYIGEAFLRLFGLTISSFAVAGSFVIFLVSLEMLLDVSIFKSRQDMKQDTTFMPVVFPTLIGAGVFTTLLSLRAQYQDIEILCGVIVNVIAIYFVLKLSQQLGRFLGPSFIYALQKFFGIILMSIAVKIFITNVMILSHQLGS